MQKVLSRSKYVSEYTARQVAARKALEENLKTKRDRINQKPTRDEIRRHTKANKQARWDSIYRGHLAPRQDVGAHAEKYGSVEAHRMQPPRVHEKLRVKCPFVKGDRVVVVGAQYRDRGRIGKVGEIQEEAQCLFINGVETAAVFKPKFMRIMTRSEDPMHTASLPIPFKDVRLVYPLENPTTGVLRDVIINEIDLRNPTRSEKQAGIDRPIRYIAGVEPPVELPYPEEKEETFTDTNSDTLRIEVEERTWVPTLGIPPMPENVINELRNRYSKYRTRFDDAFIAKKEAAHQRVMGKKHALKEAARTPLDEINLARRKELAKVKADAAEGGAWKPLSPEIIEAMARLGLESQERSGRVLPARTREQFERITEGFLDDVPEEVVSEPEPVEEDLLDGEVEVEREDRAVSQDRTTP